MTKSLNDYLAIYQKQLEIGHIQKAYKGLMNYIMELKNHFTKKYSDEYIVGNISRGYMDYTYLPITPKSIKQLKLKFVIVFNHEKIQFDICLSGQNKQIQKKYWEIFKESDWSEYQIPSSIDETYAIVYNALVETPNFNDLQSLTEQIESKSIEFIENITNILDPVQ